MDAPRHILVPVDFSEPSLAALRYALMLANGCGAWIDLLHVDHPNPRRPFERTALDRAMDDLLVDLHRAGFLRTSGHIVQGMNPAKAILDAASAHASDLIVIGTHGRTGLPRLVWGSVAEEVLRASLCPVMAVRSFPAGDAVVTGSRSRHRKSAAGRPARAARSFQWTNEKT
jgi:nucleotide-binding universal stress UspA family protein